MLNHAEPRRTLRQTPQRPRRTPLQFPLRASQRRVPCPSDGDPRELQKNLMPKIFDARSLTEEVEE